MKLSEKIAAYDLPHPFYTFEFFPPRTDQVRVMLPYHAYYLKSMSGVRESNTSYIASVNAKPSCDKRNMGSWRFDEGPYYRSCRFDSGGLWDRHSFAFDMHKYAPRDGG